LRRDEFIIERKGKPVAALMPVERLEQMCRFARRHALEAPEPQEGGPLSDEQAMDLTLEAERWARGAQRRKTIRNALTQHRPSSSPPAPPGCAGRRHGFPRSHGPSEHPLNGHSLTFH
jgi:hypothetical protein